MAKTGLHARYKYGKSPRMDFARGIAEMAAAINEGRPNRLSPQFSLHVLEATLAIQNAFESSSTYKMTTTFDPIDPMPWAK
jgi:hypothetical protein